VANAKPGEVINRIWYHALSLGYYESELLRWIDPKHRSLGQFFQDEIAAPLGLDVYIRLPDAIPNSKLAVLEGPGLWAWLTEMPLPLTLAAIYPRSNLSRALAGTDL
jgi:hypothetical protein